MTIVYLDHNVLGCDHCPWRVQVASDTAWNVIENYATRHMSEDHPEHYCSWCVDPAHPDPACHPAGQRDHVPAAEDLGDLMTTDAAARALVSAALVWTDTWERRPTGNAAVLYDAAVLYRRRARARAGATEAEQRSRQIAREEIEKHDHREGR